MSTNLAVLKELREIKQILIEIKEKKSYFCQVWVSCRDEAEASNIANTLLDKKLIVCAKQFPVKSQFIWQGQKHSDSEIMLLMDSREDLFDEVQDVIVDKHSYETPNIQATPITLVSKSTAVWMNRELK